MLVFMCKLPLLEATRQCEVSDRVVSMVKRCHGADMREVREEKCAVS